jgi:hypothetical protein
MNKPPAQISLPVLIEQPDYDEKIALRKRFKKKNCSIRHQSKYSPISCPPSLVILGGLHYPAANPLQSSIPRTVVIVQEQRPKVKECIETESSSSNVIKKRKRTSSSTRPAHNTMRHHPKIPSSPSSILPLGIPLAAAPRLPTRLLAACRATPKLFVQ